MNKIDISSWGSFAINSLFNVVKGTRLTKAQMRDGTIRFIGASAMNNGISLIGCGFLRIFDKAIYNFLCFNINIVQMFMQFSANQQVGRFAFLVFL